MPVIFSYADKKLNYSDKKRLRQFLAEVVAPAEGRVVGALNYVFCSDEFLLDINQRFLQHDFYTDIITFDLGEGTEGPIEGEVYVSIDRIKDNAKQLNLPFSTELERVVLHGLLHLCGYRDKSNKEISAMRAAENHFLALLNGVSP